MGVSIALNGILYLPAMSVIDKYPETVSKALTTS